MTRSGHDLLAWRLTVILQKLNWGESLDVDELADELKVHQRTIQRDLIDRFAFLPIGKVAGRFPLEIAFLGKLTFHAIERFAGLAAHPNQILPIVRYWIPHVKIVSPEAWQVELDKSLESNLDRKGK